MFLPAPIRRRSSNTGSPITIARAPLIWLAVAFALLVLLLARWRGLLALIGLGLSLLLVTKFMVPAILAGSSPLVVSLVGSLTVMFLMLGLTSGVGPQSLAAALGIGGSLLLAALLGDAYVHVSHLNGYTSELSAVVSQANVNVSLEGIVIAGIVIGGARCSGGHGGYSGFGGDGAPARQSVANGPRAL